MQTVIWKLEGNRGFKKSKHKIYVRKNVYGNIDWIRSGSERDQMASSYEQDTKIRIQLNQQIS